MNTTQALRIALDKIFGPDQYKPNPAAADPTLKAAILAYENTTKTTYNPENPKPLPIRLQNRRCPHCKTPYQNIGFVQVLFTPEDETIWRLARLHYDGQPNYVIMTPITQDMIDEWTDYLPEDPIVDWAVTQHDINEIHCHKCENPIPFTRE